MTKSMLSLSILLIMCPLALSVEGRLSLSSAMMPRGLRQNMMPRGLRRRNACTAAEAATSIPLGQLGDMQIQGATGLASHNSSSLEEQNRMQLDEAIARSIEAKQVREQEQRDVNEAMRRSLQEQQVSSPPPSAPGSDCGGCYAYSPESSSYKHNSSSSYPHSSTSTAVQEEARESSRTPSPAALRPASPQPSGGVLLSTRIHPMPPSPPNSPPSHIETMTLPEVTTPPPPTGQFEVDLATAIAMSLSDSEAKARAAKEAQVQSDAEYAWSLTNAEEVLASNEAIIASRTEAEERDAQQAAFVMAPRTPAEEEEALNAALKESLAAQPFWKRWFSFLKTWLGW